VYNRSVLLLDGMSSHTQLLGFWCSKHEYGSKHSVW